MEDTPDIYALTFDELEVTSAVMYAKARRFVVKYEGDLDTVDPDRPNLGDAGSELVEAAERYAEAYRRWNETRGEEES